MSSSLQIGKHICKFSNWDTDYFGKECGTVRLGGNLSSQEIKTIEQWAGSFDFVTIYNVGCNPENNRVLSLSALRPFLADINITFKQEIPSNKKFTDSDFQITVTPNLMPDESLVSLAATGFTYSRFFNDPNLSFDKARGVYAHWVKSAFMKDDRIFAKVQVQGVTCAFILFSLNKVEKSSVIELVGVSSQMKGMGLGSALVKKVLSYLGEMGVTRVTVGTQITNLEAFSFYLRQGFTFLSSTAVFHAWPQKINDQFNV